MANEETAEFQVAFPNPLRGGVYSNNMIVAHTREEFFLDFLMVAPPTGTLTARVILSPGHVKRVVAAFQENIAKYEAAFGSIRAAEAPQGKIGINGMEPGRGGPPDVTTTTESFARLPRPVWFLVVLIVISRLQSALENERVLSGLDPLTGAANTRAFRGRARDEIDRSRRYGRPFTLAYVDLDNFKAVNDRFGHSAGDNLLRLVTDNIRKNLRTTDIFARVGGDEFVLLLPETGPESARAVLDKLQDKVTSSLQEAKWPVTLSVGAVSYLSPPDSVDAMIVQTDNLLYQVKHGGKNRIRQEVHGG